MSYFDVFILLMISYVNNWGQKLFTANLKISKLVTWHLVLVRGISYFFRRGLNDIIGQNLVVVRIFLKNLPGDFGQNLLKGS